MHCETSLHFELKWELFTFNCTHMSINECIVSFFLRAIYIIFSLLIFYSLVSNLMRSLNKTLGEKMQRNVIFEEATATMTPTNVDNTINVETNNPNAKCPAQCANLAH